MKILYSHTQDLLSALRRTGSRLSRRKVQLGVALLLPLPFAAQAQSDNFDAYTNVNELTAAGWILSSLNPALVTTTLPAVGAGKGLRIQANPVPDQVPAAGMWYRTNEYSNFYLAVDIARWPGTDLDQASVMFARMTDADTGTVLKNLNPANAQGVICNYDASQYGEDQGDRRQGQLQINLIAAGFDATTLAAAEITFVPGRPYRLVFKGVGWHYTAQAYDWNDLTTPLVTIEADDTAQTHPSGACGLLAFSRNDTQGVADCTFDNYYAGATDPNPAAGSALAHPVADTPAVDSRVPSARWQNFYNVASPISFTASTYTTNIIDASATKFILNDVDVSSQLTVSTNGPKISGSLSASLLATNRLYSAQIVVSDVSGARASTNTFWLDTFSDAYLLSSSVKTIEAEEYNYSGGAYQLDPIHVSGIDTNGLQVNGNGDGYYDSPGTPEIDFFSHNATPDSNFSDFRTADPVRTKSGGLIGIEDANHATEYDPGSDTIRSPHAAAKLLEYVVGRTEPGEWLEYTRNFTSARYSVYLRYSSFGATTNELYLVTSDPTQTNQTTAKLGTFAIPNNMRFLNYLYAPLVDDTGAPVQINLSGTNTLRLQIAGTPGQDNRKTMLNYIMLAQAPAESGESIEVYSSATAAGPYTLDANATVDMAARTVAVPVAGNAHFYRVKSASQISLKEINVAASTVRIRF